MSTLRGFRVLNAATSGTVTAAALEAELASNGALGGWQALMALNGTTERMADTDVAMQVIVDSATAINAVIEQTPSRKAALNSTTAMNRVTASATAMNTLSASANARSEVGTSGTAFDAIKVSNLGIGKYVIGHTSLDPASYADMDAVAAASAARTEIGTDGTSDASPVVGASDMASAKLIAQYAGLTPSSYPDMDTLFASGADIDAALGNTNARNVAAQSVVALDKFRSNATARVKVQADDAAFAKFGQNPTGDEEYAFGRRTSDNMFVKLNADLDVVEEITLDNFGSYSSFGAGLNGEFYAKKSDLIRLDLTTGKVIWSYQIPTNQNIEHKFPAVGPNGEVAYGARNGVMGIVEPDGTERWNIVLGTGYIRCLAFDYTGDLYIANGTQSVYRLSGADGSVVWQNTTDFANSVNEVGVSRDGVFGLEQTSYILRKLDRNGVLQWSTTALYNNGSPIIFGTDGWIYHAERNSGRIDVINSSGTITQVLNKGSGHMNAWLAFKDGRVVTTDKNTLYVLKGGQFVKSVSLGLQEMANVTAQWPSGQF